MKYLTIANKGEIVTEDFTLLQTTKRGDNTKIGHFGSGASYALATLIRLGLTPIIFSGTTKFHIRVKAEQYRGITTNRILINRQASSLTTDMGPDWNVPMAIRELYANAIDEGESQLTVQEGVRPIPGYSIVAIPVKEGMLEFIQNLNKYIAVKRKPIFENEYGSIYLKDNISPVSIYHKGFYCNKPDADWIGRFDYDLNNIKINESRLYKSPGDVHYQISRLITDENFNLWKSFFDDNHSTNICDYIYETPKSFIRFAKDYLDSGGNFTTSLFAASGGFIIARQGLTIPFDFFKRLEKLGLVVNPFAELLGELDVEFVPSNKKYYTDMAKAIAINIKSFVKVDVDVYIGKISKKHYCKIHEKNYMYVIDESKIEESKSNREDLILELAAECLIKTENIQDIIVDYLK